MSRGIVVLAQNNTENNYVNQATVLALSLKKTNPNIPISIITNNEVDSEYKQFFDQIIDIPWGDSAKSSFWKVTNRWKIFHASPYKETIVMDTDMLVLDDISHYWNFFENYDIYFTTNVKTYRNEIITNNFYRETFVKNKLPNIYTGLHYFKRCEYAHNFYAYLEIVIKNWKEFYDIFLDDYKPKFVSIDVCAAITAKMMDISHTLTNPNVKSPSFVHMKPKIQNWTKGDESDWQKNVNAYLDNECNLKIGNHLQNGIFHYTEKNFLENTDALEKYRRFLNG